MFYYLLFLIPFNIVFSIFVNQYSFSNEDDAIISNDIESVLWSKLILVGAIGSIMASTRSTFLEILDSPYGMSICERMMKEIYLAAESKGVLLPNDLIEENLRYLLKDKDNIQSSLQQDIFS